MRIPRVELVVDPATLAKSSRGTITGAVWLRDGDADTQADFPEVGWSDSVVAVLAGWLPELQRLARTIPATDASADCRFIDGPYLMRVRVERPGLWGLGCVEQRTHGTPSDGPEWRTDSAVFLASVTRAATTVLGVCDVRGWWSTDTESLRRAIESGQRSH
ncbi:MAG: hypothetical protein M3Z10_02615 [Gemmatimonadota bacterium]|nr:hypothetical protein [Gemmatimonadota bacterium]